MDLVELLKRPEGKTLEFKRDLSTPEGALKTIIAFANTAGGALLVGVGFAGERTDWSFLRTATPARLQREATWSSSRNTTGVTPGEKEGAQPSTAWSIRAGGSSRRLQPNSTATSPHCMEANSSSS